MLVKEWMATKPIVIEENTSIMKVTQLMKEYGIRRVPVVRRNRLVGILSDRDIKEAAPSKATSLDVHELYYLLSEIKVKEIMTPSPITLSETDSVEKAAVIMLNNRISGLPVVDDQGFVVGMITQTDVFKVMISITGIYRGPIQLACDIEDQTGVLHQLLNIIRSHEARIISVLTSVDHVAPGRKEAYIRIMDMPDDKVDSMAKEINKTFKVLYVTREDVSEIPQKEKKSAA